MITSSAAMLWSLSTPGIILYLWLLSAVGLAVGSIAWVIRLGQFALDVDRRRSPRSGWWFAIGPTLGALLFMAHATDLPLRVRWSVAEDDFNDVVEEIRLSGDRDFFLEEETRIGTYRISRIYRLDDAVVFRESNGSGLNRAGFIYLPGGSAPEEQDSQQGPPVLDHLGGDWYAWTRGL